MLWSDLFIGISLSEVSHNSVSNQWTWLQAVMNMLVGNFQPIWNWWWGFSTVMFVNTLSWSSNRLIFFGIYEYYLLLCSGICLYMVVGQLDWNFTYSGRIFWQTAIKMYKLVGEERFLLWAVCSIQLQVLPAFFVVCCPVNVMFSCYASNHFKDWSFGTFLW